MAREQKVTEVQVGDVVRIEDGRMADKWHRVTEVTRQDDQVRLTMRGERSGALAWTSRPEEDTLIVR